MNPSAMSSMPKPKLNFRPDGSFTILMVSDIHGGVGYAKEQTAAALEALVKKADPDLVLFGGDTAGPGVIHIETAEQLREMLTSLTEPLESRRIPWAHVYGNHDDNFGLPNGEQQKVYESFPCCLSETGPDDVPGVGNYVLPVYGKDGRVRFCVYAMDSHRGIGEFRRETGLPQTTRFLADNDSHNCTSDVIRFEQIRWYWDTSVKLEGENGGKVPGLLYMHTPLPEFELCSRNRDETKLRGWQLEDVSCAPVNSGLFSAVLQRGDVKAIFCGHDHENDFAATYCGVKLGYDGFLSYHACHNEDIRGGRVFRITEDHPAEIETEMLRVRDCL